MLTTADFRTERVTLRGIGDAGLDVVGADGKPRAEPFDRVLQIDRTPAPPAPVGGGRFVLSLAGGERLAGEPIALDGETLRWSNPALGEMKLPMSRVTSLARASRAQSSRDATRESPAAEDVITLSNGDTVRGIVAGVTDKTVTVQSAAGEATDVPLDSVAAVDFAAVAGGANAPKPHADNARAFRVTLADSTTITAPSLRLAGDQLAMSLADQSSRKVPLAAVASVEQVNGPVVWLSSRPPVENVHTPFLDRPAPARMNLTAAGEPIRFADHAYARGIGVHSYSRLTWDFDAASYKAFRTQYAIDGQLPYANVTVRIKLDDRVAHEQKDFRAGALSPLVVLDTRGAKRITLEVDWGETYDVQDRFNWIEPALLKEKPRPPDPPKPAAPATAPASRPATTPAG